MRCIKLTFILLFVLVSLILSLPVSSSPRGGFHSSDLDAVVSVEENIKRTDYFHNGTLTYAADKCYATKIETRDGNSILEEYFDEIGAPSRQKNGSYALLRELDKEGHEYRVTYLDKGGKPMIITAGYAILLRSYNDFGLVEYEIYLDVNEEPIKRSNGAYSRRNEYENNRNTVVVYLDGSGKPTRVESGYAIMKRTYYGDGQIETETYFDADEKPIALALGQYGVHYEYDGLGRKAVLTYLNVSGSPAVTNLGYTTVKRTFHPDDTVETTMYYDADGLPVALSHGQYGVKHVNGKKIYLNKDGKEFFNLNNWLHNNSVAVVAIGILVAILSLVLGRKWNCILLILYLVFVFYMTLMYRVEGDANAEMELFWSYKQFLSSPSLRLEILYNIWLFVPLGTILCRIWPRVWVVLIALAISVFIEVVQYHCGIGLAELDDIISNGLGGLIGYGACKVYSQWRPAHNLCK